MSTHPLGSMERPVWVAVIGSGPSGFYAADALFKAEGIHACVDVFDRLPTPYGLVRGGVAPDHQKIKSVINSYERTASKEGFRFFGNVMLGSDISVEDLCSIYDCLIYAVGNESDRKMGIPGEDLEGVHSATAFVGWYNGHPDFQDESFDLAKAERVAVIGNGNVAIDVARILAQHSDNLAATDISDAALNSLAGSSVKEVLLLGRRGPAQAAFSPKEIKELSNLEGSELVVNSEDIALDEVSVRWLEEAAPASAKKNVSILEEQAGAQTGDAPCKVICRFLVSPVEMIGDSGRLTGVRLERGHLVADDSGTPRARGTGELSDEKADLVFKAVGYRGVKIPGVPFDDGWGIIPNREGRVLNSRDSKNVVADQYVVGWAKRGPSGLIGTNNADSKATVANLLTDIADRSGEALAPDHKERTVALLRERGVDFVTFADWKRLDDYEMKQGEAKGKVREKITEVPEMLKVVNELRSVDA